MKCEEENALLYIEPYNNKTNTPVLDELTIKVFNAWKTRIGEGVYMNGGLVRGLRTMGLHECRCGKYSGNSDYELEGGKITNTLCVHYMAYHRNEVPEKEMKKVEELDASTVLLEGDEDLLNKMIYKKLNDSRIIA